MKKRLLSIILVLVMILTCAVPSFAAAYDKPEVEAAYEAYLKLKEARDAEVKDVKLLADLMAKQEAANENLEWEDTELMPDDFFSVMMDASAVIQFDAVREAFLAEKNGKTAKELIDMVETLKEGNYTELAEAYFSDFQALCAEAKKLAPSANVTAVHDAFSNLNTQLEMAFWPEDLAAALDGFKKVESKFKSLSSKDLENLALLLEIDLKPAELKAHISDVVKRSEDAVKAMDSYNKFSELYNSGEAAGKDLTAAGKAYVKVYDQVMASADDAQTMILYTLYPELDYLYNQAKLYTLPEKAVNVYTGINAFRESLFGAGIEAFEAAAAAFEADVLPMLEKVTAADLDVVAKALDYGTGAEMKEAVLDQLTRVKEEVEAGKVLKETLPDVKFRAKSAKTTLRGKKAVKLTWAAPEGVELDGYQVFRSTKKYSGFGTEPIFDTSLTSYTNNKGIKAGSTYYYKVRGYKYICNEIVYTDWSWKAWRTF